MARIGHHLRALAQTYLDAWLLLQVAHRSSMTSQRDTPRGFVLICGPCAQKKAATEHLVS